MTLALLFWIILVVWLVVSVWLSAPAPNWRIGLPWVLCFVLFLILGWAVFGAPVRG